MVDVLLEVKGEIGLTVWWAHHSLFLNHSFCPFCDFLLGFFVDVSAEGWFSHFNHLPSIIRASYWKRLGMVIKDSLIYWF